MSGEVFLVVMAICAGILTSVVVWLAIRLVRTLDKADKILNEINGVFSEIEIFKSGIRMGLVTLITALVAKLRLPAEYRKGAEKSE